MTSGPSEPSAKGPSLRVFVVEDEVMIRMLLEDMLSDLGYEIAAAAGRVAEAMPVATEAQFDVAILDINLSGETVFPVADILEKRGVPFVFSTGYGDGGLPPPYRSRPILQKPFQMEGLKAALASVFAGRKA